MPEFHIELELQGLKLKIRGSREDVPAAMHQIGRQVTGLLNPIAEVVEGEVVEETPSGKPEVIAGTPVTAAKKRTSRKPKRVSSTANGGGASSDDVVNWNHDPSKWGYPLKTWKGWEKAIWLLYVISQETSPSELTSSQIVQTFNAKFTSAGTLAHISVNRDLARRQMAPDLLVHQNDGRWKLLDNGVSMAQVLVAAALGKEAVTANA